MKHKFSTFLLIFVFFATIECFCQKTKLNEERTKYYHKDNKKLYNSYINYKREQKKIYPPSPILFGKKKFNRLIKFFNIPSNKRLEIYPFNTFDSIYFCTFNFIEDKEPRDYLDGKYYNYIRLLESSEINRITNIIFNYFKMQGGNSIELGEKNIGCYDVYRYYPKMMLLFKKNGKFTNYIAFPENGTKRSNFFEGKDAFEYWQELDLCAEKEDLILKMFGFDRNYD